MGSFDIDRGPGLFWLFFVGMPLIFVGGILSAFGFAGVVAKYQVREMSPAASEAINRVGTGATPGIHSVAAAIAGGLSGRPSTAKACDACGSSQDEDARFCDDCGARLSQTRTCSACNAHNDPDARYCDACGIALTSA